MLSEKESGFKAQLYQAGVSAVTYWASWWIIFIMLSGALAITLGVAFWAVAFYDASLWLIITFFFLVSLSAFTLVWALQPLCFSAHQSTLTIMFAFLILLAPHALIDQTHLPVPAIDKENASYSAMVAAKETLHLLTKFSSLKYGLDFSNYDVVMDNYSVSTGFKWLIKDSTIYFFIGLILEACLSGVSIGCERVKLAKIANKQVSAVQNPNYNETTEHSRIINEATTIRKTGLQVIDLRLSPDQVHSINLSVKPGELCCLTGVNSDLQERLHFLRLILS